MVKSLAKALEGVSEPLDVVARGWFAGIASGRQFGVDGQPPKERKAHAGGHVFGPALAKEVNCGPVRSREAGHVLHHSEDRNPQLLEHPDGPPGVILGHFLGRADHDRPGEGEELGQGERNVTRAGGEVHDQVVQFSPVALEGELTECSMGHGATPDQCFFRFDQTPN